MLDKINFDPVNLPKNYSKKINPSLETNLRITFSTRLRKMLMFLFTPTDGAINKHMFSRFCAKTFSSQFTNHPKNYVIYLVLKI